MNRVLSEKRTIRALCALMVFMIIMIALAQASVYAAASPIRIKVEQTFYTTSVYADDMFSYILKPLDADAPMPPASTAGAYSFAIAGNSAFEISTLAFSKEGFYRYEIYQNIGAAKSGYTYDRRIYTIEIRVDAKLNALVVALHNNNKVDRILFDNGYSLQPTGTGQMTDLPVIKTLSGSPARDTEFSFTLIAHSASNPMPAGSSGGAKTIWTTGPGQARFGTWSYNRTGTYYYTVYEENGGVRGYTYDTTVYTITDRVTEEYGKLVLSRIVTNDMNKPVASFDFHNIYGGVLGGGGTERENPGTVITDGGNPGGNPGGESPSGGNPGGGNPITDITDGGNPGGNPGGDPGAGRPGVTGPKTGDDTNALLLIILLIAGGTLAAGAVIYLIVSGKRKSVRQLT